MNSSLTNSSSLVLFVCGSPPRFLLFCHAERSSKLGEKQKKDEFFSFSLFLFFFFSLSLAFFSLSRLDKTKTSLTKAFLPFYDDAERRRQTTRRRQRQRRTEKEEEEEESETKEEEEEEDINNNVSKSAS